MIDSHLIDGHLSSKGVGEVHKPPCPFPPNVQTCVAALAALPSLDILYLTILIDQPGLFQSLYRFQIDEAAPLSTRQV